MTLVMSYYRVSCEVCYLLAFYETSEGGRGWEKEGEGEGGMGGTGETEGRGGTGGRDRRTFQLVQEFSCGVDMCFLMYNNIPRNYLSSCLGENKAL